MLAPSTIIGRNQYVPTIHVAIANKAIRMKNPRVRRGNMNRKSDRTLLCCNCLDGAASGARAAVNTGRRVNHALAVRFGNRSGRAVLLARAASDALLGINLVSHFQFSFFGGFQMQVLSHTDALLGNGKMQFFSRRGNVRGGP